MSAITTTQQLFGTPSPLQDLHDSTVEAIASMLESLPPSMMTALCSRLNLVPIIDSFEDLDDLFPEEELQDESHKPYL